MDNAENNVVDISNSLELSEYEMREIFAKAGQGLPLFGDVAGSPAEAARKNYDGNWSSPSGLGCICGLETTRRGPSLRDAMLRIGDGDVEGAWFEINTPGWRGFEASEIFKAFLSVSGFEVEKKCIYDWASENGEPTGETNVW